MTRTRPHPSVAVLLALLVSGLVACPGPVAWLEPGVPRQIAIEMSTPIMDGASFPAWELTATMTTTLWAFDLVVDEAPACDGGG